MLDFLSGIMQTALTFFYDITKTVGIPSYGIAIILLTIVIKLILYPLTVKQIKSMKAMQEMQPKLKEIQDKYKSNPEKLQKEMTNLYKEAGVNPLSGCLPLLVQMPFLIAIFFAIREYSYDPAYQSFLWMPNLALEDPTYIMPVLSAVTTYIQSKQTMTDNTQQNKMMLIFMPLFIGYISTTFPSGLVLYWVASNIIQIIQQWFMYRKQPTQNVGEASK